MGILHNKIVGHGQGWEHQEVAWEHQETAWTKENCTLTTESKAEVTVLCAQHTPDTPNLDPDPCSNLQTLVLTSGPLALPYTPLHIPPLSLPLDHSRDS